VDEAASLKHVHHFVAWPFAHKRLIAIVIILLLAALNVIALVVNIVQAIQAGTATSTSTQ